MTDLPVVADAAVRDPLVLLLGLLALGGVATHVLLRRFPLARAIARVLVLVVLTIVLLRADVVPYRPLQLTGSPVRDAVHGILKITWWVGAAWFVVGVLRAFVFGDPQKRESKLLQELSAGLVYLAAVFAIIAYVLDLPIQGLLATSGAIAIILGLALQSTLGDMFSGLVLNFSRPYRPGDWINLEGGTSGRVIEMNWRATLVLTGRHDLAIVPNSTIAKSRIINVSSPSGVHGTTVTLQLDTRTPPSVGTEILRHAVLNCRSITTTPSASVVVKSITAAYTEFEITFFVADLGAVTDAQNELFDMIYRHLFSAGLELALPDNTAHRTPVNESVKEIRTPAERSLELVDIFRNLTSADRAALAAKLKLHSYERGDVLLEPGTVVNALFIVASGVLSLARGGPDLDIELLRLGPGDHFGEVGLLTGAPSIVRITALTPAIAYELPKKDLAPILEARPEVSQEVCRALAQRQALGRSTAVTEIDRTVPVNRLASWFSEQFRRLHDIARAE